AKNGSGVGQAEVFDRFRENLERLTGLLAAAVAALPDPAGCTCSTWADGIELTYDTPRVVRWVEHLFSYFFSTGATPGQLLHNPTTGRTGCRRRSLASKEHLRPHDTGRQW